MGRLDGHVAMISGGAGALGAAIVRAMAGEGARVVVADILEREGAALAAELGEQGVFVHLDVQSTEQWQAAVDAAEQRFGALTILVNNAAVLRKGSVAQTTTADWDFVMSVNLTGSFKGMRAAAPAMERAGGGSIINISSTAGMKGFADSAAYVASKWGVRGLTKHGAMDLAPKNIRVNSIHPGHLVNQMMSLDASLADVPMSFAHVPMQRPGRPDEITGLVVYLASDLSTYCTGAEFLADGGEMAGLAAAV